MSSLKKVFIVEDNVVNRKMLCKILQNNYSIVEAENGQEALELLRKQADSVSVVLLDIVMPVMDGYDVLREMRKDKVLSKIPVIVASGKDDEESETKALALGANDYIVKPYKPNIIKHRIANTIYLRETSAFINAYQHDALTGLYTKEYFYHCAYELLKNNPNQEYDIICCDIERFKLVNDLYGVQEGDALLRHVAKIIQRNTEGYGICCRMNGDIFAIFIERPSEYLADYFISSYEYINRFNENFNTTIKYGIFQIINRNIPISIMCDRAYLAVKDIKGKFDIFYAYYDDEIRQKMLDEQFVLTNMESALINGEFQVYFQPKYDLRTEEITSSEALVRWIHPQKGLIPPNEFIPYLERNGFITKLDIYIWEEVCKKIRSWIDEGIKPIPVSVNMSRADIYNPNIDQILISLIKKYRLSPQYLYLEITETSYMENEKELTQALQKLKKLGFIIEMDDFGSGYSSLNMLAELPIDVLKLDMRFIQGGQISKNRKNIISFIISMAKWLNMHVVAEGVETIEQVELLKSLGCERAQGYYYSKPLPADMFEKLLLFSHEDSMSANDLIHASNTVPDVLAGHGILVLDEEGLDFCTLSQVLNEKYSVLHIGTIDEALEVISKYNQTLTAVVMSLTDSTTIEQISVVVGQCTLGDIPVITIHDSELFISNCIENGVSDCIVRPYSLAALQNRIQNAICRVQISKFQKEKEVSTAITEMKRRAEKDSLTGLLNRAEFEIRIHDFFNYNKRPEGIFMILDIDHFKRVNDSLGHIAGDKVLCAIADFLHEIFPETNIISRLGGDEFAIFIPYQIDQPEVERKLKRICQSFSVDIGALKISCSVGVCFSPEYGLDYEELYNNADIALLNAKQRGKCQYVIYERGLDVPNYTQLEQKATALLNDVSDAMFVCDAVSSEIIYINNTACHVINKSKASCIGARCFELFWDRCRNCDRCLEIDSHIDQYYEEDTFLKDGKTTVHIKAKLGEWDGKKVKIHYLQGI